MPEVPISELWDAVRAHPDFAFGVMFTTKDFPGGVVPDYFAGPTEDRMVEVANEAIANECGTQAW